MTFKGHYSYVRWSVDTIMVTTACLPCWTEPFIQPPRDSCAKIVSDSRGSVLSCTYHVGLTVYVRRMQWPLQTATVFTYVDKLHQQPY